MAKFSDLSRVLKLQLSRDDVTASRELQQNKLPSQVHCSARLRFIECYTKKTKRIVSLYENFQDQIFSLHLRYFNPLVASSSICAKANFTPMLWMNQCNQVSTNMPYHRETLGILLSLELLAEPVVLVMSSMSLQKAPFLLHTQKCSNISIIPSRYETYHFLPESKLLDYSLQIPSRQC